MVTEEHITAFNWASTQEIDDMLATTLRVNDFLTGMFGAVGITLVDFKIEFGRLWEDDILPRDPRRRDQPRQLPAVGRTDQREARQGPLPPRPGRRDRELHRGRAPAGDHEGDADASSRAGALDARADAAGQGRASSSSPACWTCRARLSRARSARPGLRGGGRASVSARPSLSTLTGDDSQAAEAEVRKRMCERLLANTVIEGYRVEIG